jgi:hypothetical protein
MYDTICNLIPPDPDYPPRARTIDILYRVLNGTLYDVLPHNFHEEYSIGGEYIPLRKRRPSVRYGLCRIVVEDSVALLFSEGHFPTVDCTDVVVRETLSDIFEEAALNQIMTEAAICGSVGSVAILMRVLRGRVFFQVLNTRYLTPIWDPGAPDSLLMVRERYKVSGQRLIDTGYQIADPESDYWFERRWDTEAETWFNPVAVSAKAGAGIDLDRSTRHGLGFVPIVWVRNLPGSSATGDTNDGACTFQAAIAAQIEIDYQLSQAGRGLKYSSDPTLLIKEPAVSDGNIIKGAGNALVVGEKGDARLLEIGGTASGAVIEYVRMLRELALESVHGNRSSADRLTAAQSGRALELMNQGLLWLADNLRISYGNMALLALSRMILRAAQVFRLQVMGREVPALDPAARLSVRWPQWYPFTADDRQKTAQTVVALVDAGLLSRAAAVTTIADVFDVTDIAGELKNISSTDDTDE